MKAFLGSIYYCNKCDEPYNNKDHHKCSTHNDVCKLCKKAQHSQEEKNKIYCKRYCFNQNRFDNHSEVCREVYKCKDCDKILLRSKEHICGYSFCYNCHETNKYKTNKTFLLLHSQHLMQDCGCMICWTNSENPLFTMIQTALFTLIMEKA